MYGRVQNKLQGRHAKETELGGTHKTVVVGELRAGIADFRATQDGLAPVELYLSYRCSIQDALLSADPDRCTKLREEPWTSCWPPAAPREALGPVHRPGAERVVVCQGGILSEVALELLVGIDLDTSVRIGRSTWRL